MALFCHALVPCGLRGALCTIVHHILDLAKRGASIRLRELMDEAKLLLGLFPHLRDSFDEDELPISFIVAEKSGRLTKGSGESRRRGRMSAEARNAVSVRMKKYWAERRKAK